MTTSAPVMLGEDDGGRVFAHPDHIPSDRTTLCMLIRDVHRRIQGATDPIEAWIPTPEQWYRHVIIPRPREIALHDTLTVVGFFGRRRDVVSLSAARAIQDLSAKLERLIPSFPGVLAYSTHLLADELNYANLVLMASSDVISAWRDIAPHPIAAGAVSKEYYAFIRIYHGSVKVEDLATEGAIRLHRVKYWDYRSDPTWTAQRELARR